MLPLHGEFVSAELLLACSEGCGLHHNRLKVRCCFSSARVHCTNWHSIVHSMLLVYVVSVQSQTSNWHICT